MLREIAQGKGARAGFDPQRRLQLGVAAQARLGIRPPRTPAWPPEPAEPQERGDSSSVTSKAANAASVGP